MEITPLSQEFDSFLGKKIIPSIAHVCPKCYRVLGTCLNWRDTLDELLLKVAGSNADVRSNGITMSDEPPIPNCDVMI